MSLTDLPAHPEPVACTRLTHRVLYAQGTTLELACRCPEVRSARLYSFLFLRLDRVLRLWQRFLCNVYKPTACLGKARCSSCSNMMIPIRTLQAMNRRAHGWGMVGVVRRGTYLFSRSTTRGEERGVPSFACLGAPVRRAGIPSPVRARARGVGVLLRRVPSK